MRVIEWQSWAVSAPNKKTCTCLASIERELLLGWAVLSKFFDVFLWLAKRAGLLAR